MSDKTIVLLLLAGIAACSVAIGYIAATAENPVMVLICALLGVITTVLVSR